MGSKSTATVGNTGYLKRRMILQIDGELRRIKKIAGPTTVVLGKLRWWHRRDYTNGAHYTPLRTAVHALAVVGIGAAIAFAWQSWWSLLVSVPFMVAGLLWTEANGA